VTYQQYPGRQDDPYGYGEQQGYGTPQQGNYQQTQYQQTPYQQTQYQQTPYQQTPYQQAPYQQTQYPQAPYQQVPYQQQYAPPRVAAQRSRQAPPPSPRKKWPWVVGGIVALIVVGSIATNGAKKPTVAVAPSGQGTTNAQAAAGAAPAAAAPAPSGPPSEVGDGTYQVGTDIDAGRWKTAGPDKSSVFPVCYMARHKDDSADFRSIIANDSLQGPGSVTVKKGEFLELKGGCTWTKVG
jgi:hypothetical protein